MLVFRRDIGVASMGFRKDVNLDSAQVQVRYVQWIHCNVSAELITEVCS